MPEHEIERNKKMKPCVDCSTDEPELVTAECSRCERDWLHEVQCRGCLRRTGLFSEVEAAVEAWQAMR
jgi:hypothetical protein